MKRLIISDLHLGAPHALGAHPLVLDRLTSALQGVQELVIAGDLLALPTAPFAECVRAAAPLLALAGRLVDRILYLPGNHDFHLAAVSFEERAVLEAAGRPFPAGRLPFAERLLSALAPGAEVVTAHPFARLDGVSVLHGHQLGAHSNPALAGDPDITMGSLYEAYHGLVQAGDPHPDLSAAVYERLIGVRPGQPRGGLMSHRELVGALARACAQLKVPPGEVIFAHSHQPLSGYRLPGEHRWRFHNTGSWVLDRYLIEHEPDPRDAWPGTAIALTDGRIQPLRLLDDLTMSELRTLLPGA